MADSKTISVYDAKVADYVDITQRDEIDPDLLRFMKVLEPGAFVLDLGCGPGAASSVMLEHGLKPDPVDASAEMVRFAIQTHGLAARVATFDEIEGDALYDGVWANFSLLHAARGKMPDHLVAIHDALKPGGYFHIGMKIGEGEERDSIGRFYTFYSDQELTRLLKEAGFEVLERSFGEGGGLSGKMEPWVTMLCRRD